MGGVGKWIEIFEIWFGYLEDRFKVMYEMMGSRCL